MKLGRKHIGQLFDTHGDGSWVYQLVAVSKGWLLLYSFDGNYYKERAGAHYDWRPFRPTKPWPKQWLAYGWTCAREK